MKQTLIRLIIFAVFALLLHYVVKTPAWLLWSFIATYILEGAVTQILNRG